MIATVSWILLVDNYQGNKQMSGRVKAFMSLYREMSLTLADAWGGEAKSGKNVAFG